MTSAEVLIRPAALVRGGVPTILRLEGLVVMAVAVSAYAVFNLNWWLFAALFLLPDVVIWIAHIGFDRALGYGLKYPSAFGDTHLSTPK